MRLASVAVDLLELAAQEVAEAEAAIDRHAAELAARLTPSELAELDPRFYGASLRQGEARQ